MLRSVSTDLSWEMEQIEKISRENPAIFERVLPQLWKLAPDLQQSVVIGAYLDNQISLAKAAEMLGLTRRELEQQFVEKGIPIRQLSKEDVIAEVKSARKF